MSIKERIHRWRFRKLYAAMPEFFREFYPIERAISLLVQNAVHQMNAARDMDEHASKSLGRVVEMEREITHLRLALANAKLGWNEDRVDRFMENFFPKRQHAEASEGAA